MTRWTGTSTLAPALLFSLCPSVAADVFVVDDTGGTGVDYLTIQPAVNAALDGDVVVVRPGSYPGFGIDGKGVSVVAETGSDVVLQNEIAVRNLPSDSQVSLVGLTSIGSQLGSRGLVASNNAGTVWLEDCVFHGYRAEAVGLFQLAEATPGVFALNCSNLILMDFAVVGGDGGTLTDEDTDPAASAGADAVLADACTVFAYGGEWQGGRGGSNQDTVTFPGGRGGDALHINDGSLVFAEGVRLIGGHGGSGDEDAFSGCGDGGRGGHGIYAFQVGAAIVRDCVYQPGPGGGAGGASCSSGADGVPIETFGGTQIAHPGIAKRLNAPAPVLSGGTATIHVTGAPGDRVWAQTAQPLDPTYFPSLASPSLVDLPRRLVFLGTCDGAGQLTRVLPMPTLNPGEDFRRHLQGYFLDTQNQGRLGSGCHLIVLGG